MASEVKKVFWTKPLQLILLTIVVTVILLATGILTLPQAGAIVLFIIKLIWLFFKFLFLLFKWVIVAIKAGSLNQPLFPPA